MLQAVAAEAGNGHSRFNDNPVSRESGEDRYQLEVFFLKAREL